MNDDEPLTVLQVLRTAVLGAAAALAFFALGASLATAGTPPPPACAACLR